MFQRRAGFSLVEMLVVIGIVGVLVGLTIPAVQSSREAASKAACSNQLRQMGIGLHTFHDVQHQFPPLPSRGQKDPNRILSWMAQILPQMGHFSLYEVSEAACAADSDGMHNPPHIGFATVIPSYLCPSDVRLATPLVDSFNNRAGFTSYVGISGGFDPRAMRGLLGALHGGARIKDFRDGTSSTIMVGERPPPDNLQAGWWYPGFEGEGISMHGPTNRISLGSIQLPQVHCNIKGTFGPGRLDNPCDRFHLWSLHRGGANFLFADGSVRFLSYESEPIILSLVSLDGGEIVELP